MQKPQPTSSTQKRIADATASFFVLLNADADGDERKAAKARRTLRRLGVNVELSDAKGGDDAR